MAVGCGIGVGFRKGRPLFNPDAYPTAAWYFDVNRSVTVDTTLGTTTASALGNICATGSGWNVAQGTKAAQPTIVTQAYGGRTALRFDGSDDTLAFSGAGLSFCNNVPGLTIICVGKFNLISAARILFKWSVSASTTDRVYAAIAATNRLQIGAKKLDGDSSSYKTASTNDSGALEVITFCWDYVAATVSIDINGSQLLAPTSFQTGTTNSSATSAQVAHIGSSNGAACFNGDLIQAGGWQSALSAADKLSIVRAMGRENGITTA